FRPRCSTCLQEVQRGFFVAFPLPHRLSKLPVEGPGQILAAPHNDREKRICPSPSGDYRTSTRHGGANIMASGPPGTTLDRLDQWAGQGSLDGLTDRELLGRFADHGDEPAFAELVRRHGPMALGVCRRLLGAEADAEDAFQAVFMVLVLRARSIRKRESVGSWLYGVAYRVARRARDSARRPAARPGRGAARPAGARAAPPRRRGTP